MKQDNNQYEFRAMTIQKTVIAMILWVFIFFVVFISMDMLLFNDEIGTDVFTTLKTTGVPLILSFGILIVISHTIISSKYVIQLSQVEIIIIQNKKIKYRISIDEVNSIQLGISEKPVMGFIKLNYKKYSILLFNGLFFTFFKEKNILSMFFTKSLNPFLKNNPKFKLEIKKNRDNTKYIYKKK